MNINLKLCVKKGYCIERIQLNDVRGMYSLSFTIVRMSKCNANACINVYVVHAQLCVLHGISSHRLIFDVVEHSHNTTNTRTTHANEKEACVERFFPHPILRRRYASYSCHYL